MRSHRPAHEPSPTEVPGGTRSCRRALLTATALAALVTTTLASYLLRYAGGIGSRDDDPRLAAGVPAGSAATPPPVRDAGARPGGTPPSRRSRSTPGGDGGSPAGAFGAAPAIGTAPISASCETLSTRAADAEWTDLELSGVAALEGTAWAPDGTPVAACRVQLATTGRQRAGLAHTDHEGVFRFTDLAPGAGYRLRVTPPSGFEEEVLALVLEPGSQNVDVTLRESGGGKLRLTLIDPGGEPVENRIVAARGAAGPAGARAVTDAAGRVVLEDVPAGNVVIESVAPPRLTVSGLVLRPGESVDVEIVAALGEHTIEGVVTDADDAPLVGVPVTATWSRRESGVRSGVVHTALTDGSGGFTLHGLGAGSFEISAVAAGYQRARASVQVPAVQPVRLTLPSIR